MGCAIDMRRVVIKREKCKFVGILIEYWCIVNFDKNEFMQYFKLCDEYEDEADNSVLPEIKSGKGRLYIDFRDDRGNSIRKYLQAFPVNNGKTAEIEIDEQRTILFVFAKTSTGAVFSNQVVIPTGFSDLSYSIKTDYSMFGGTSLYIA